METEETIEEDLYTEVEAMVNVEEVIITTEMEDKISITTMDFNRNKITSITGITILVSNKTILTSLTKAKTHNLSQPLRTEVLPSLPYRSKIV